MAKKIKLPLEMANGVAVRTIEELKENWDLEKIVSYYHNGRLLTWLNDRYYDEQAERIQALDKDSDANELQKQICGIFDIPFTEEETVDVKAVAARNEKLNKLRKLTSDDEILKNVDKVAFNQEELADLLDEDEPVIYLADNKFSIPLTVKNKKYIGVGDTTAVISSNKVVDFKALGIYFVNIRFDEKYNEIFKPVEYCSLAEKYYYQENYKEAMIWYRKAAELGYSVAQGWLGFMYYTGKGVNESYEEAAKWYRKAAEQGYDDAQDRLAYMYETGKSVEQSYIEAAKWYQKAAVQGNAEAQNSLADLYYKGDGVEKNYAEAAKWFRKSAEQGNDTAQFNLAVLYYEGEGVEKNYAEAAKWFRKSAEQDNSLAEYYLARMYRYGEGVTQDYGEAVKWYHKATEAWHPFAESELNDLLVKMPQLKNLI